MNQSTCSICADFLTSDNCTACPCGHTFHSQCIMTWKEHSATCPQCRVRFKNPIKLYFELSTTEESDVDVASLRNQLSDLKFKLSEKDRSTESIKEQNATAMNQLSLRQQEIAQISQLLQSSQGTNEALKKQLSYMEKFKAEAQRARTEVVQLQKSLAGLKMIEECIKGERHDVEDMLKNMTCNTDSMNQIVTSHIILKKEFDLMKEAKRKLESERKDLRRKAESASREAFDYKERLSVVTKDMSHLNSLNKGLEQKLRKLEQSFASPSPRSSAIKRLLMESPVPFDLKRARVSDIQEQSEQDGDGSLILFGDTSPVCIEDDSDIGCSFKNQQKCMSVKDEEESKELANEFGLKYIPTTSLTSSRAPLKDINRSNTSRLNIANKKSAETSNMTSSTSSLPHFRKGFNGMGGQSKVLVLPKKTTSAFVRPALPKENHKRIKIPRNNTKISKFLSTGPRLPSISISP